MDFSGRVECYPLFKTLNVEYVIIMHLINFIQTIVLPYHPPEYMKNEIANKFIDGYKSSGSTVWFYTGLNTGNVEDLNFTFLNTTFFENVVSAELYFENLKDLVTNSGLTREEYGVLISYENITLSEFATNENVLCAKGEKITNDGKYGIRFYGSKIKAGNTYYTLPYAIYKNADGETLTVYADNVGSFTPISE